MGRVQKFSPSTRDSPTRQARWPVGPTRGPKRAGPRAVSLNKKNSTCIFFQYPSLTHTLRRDTSHTLRLRLFFSTLLCAHFSSTHGVLVPFQLRSVLVPLQGCLCCDNFLVWDIIQSTKFEMKKIKI